MIDLYQVLVMFLAVVCAPTDTAEIGVFTEGGRSTYLANDNGKWKDYKHGTVQDFTLKISERKDGEGNPQRVYEGVAKLDGNEILMTKEFSIPAGVFADAKGTFLISLRAGDPIVLRKYDEGIDIDPPSGRPSVHIRWKPKGRKS